MADEEKDDKTEEATPRRREEARDKGQVAFSTETVAAAMLLSLLLSAIVTGPLVVSSAGALVVDGVELLQAPGVAAIDIDTAVTLVRGTAEAMVGPLLLLLLPMLLVGLVVGFSQVGVRFAPKAVELNFQKLDPMQGAKKMLGARGWMRTLLGVAKISLVSIVVLTTAFSFLPRASNLAGVDTAHFLRGGLYVWLRAVGAGILTIVALALVDLLFQRNQLSKDLRMTRKELRDESKNTEGDPLVKSRIRQVQRELASRRMMEDVPDATVVVTNPTHFAVALKYDDAGIAAPTVVAKGVDAVALRIREVAAGAGVIVHEEPPLARALHRSCEIGDPVPAELFEAVARVLAYVYRMQGRTPVGA